MIKKRRGAVILPLRAHYRQQAASNSVPSSVIMHFRMDETSGTVMRNSANGGIYSPAAAVVVDPEQAGYIEFNTPNAIHIINNTEGSTPIDLNFTMDFSKVYIHMATMKVDIIGSSRMSAGVAGQINSFYMSDFGALHYGINDLTTPQSNIHITTARVSSGTDTKTWVMIWDGPTSTLSARVLNLDGSIHTGSPSTPIDFSQVGALTGTMAIGNETRNTNANYYNWTCWELDRVPDFLNYKLAIISNLHIDGYKGAVDLR